MATATYASSTYYFEEEWADALQEQLDEPTKWKDFANVVFTDKYTINNPYQTDPSVSTLERDTPFSLATITQATESINVSTSKIIAQQIDRAVLAQSTYADKMEWARRQGVVMDEAIETAIYNDHAEYTDFTNTAIGGSAGSITVSASNVDDICRAMLREIRQASGQGLLKRNGAFIVWHPGDFEQLEAFAMANGFVTADSYLKNAAGAVEGIRYMGIDHYTSNLLYAGRFVGGIKKAIHVYLLNSTYGDVRMTDGEAGLRSSVIVNTRVDFDTTVWNNLAGVVFDMHTAASS
jgi:hypothetical protein